MTKLLDKLIELSRIENAAKVKNSSVTDIKKVITDSINQRKQIVAGNNQILTYTKSKKISILAEESDVSTIINNIIDNAIKYSGKNSKINITTSIIENKNNKELVLVKIKDNGIGIEEKHLPKIKDRFYRVDKARSKSSNSSGLGLSIVKSLLLRTDKDFILCLVSGDKRCSLNKVKKIINNKDVSMANADQVKEQTGFSIGGVSPIGHLEKINILVDKSLSRFENISATTKK